MAITKIQPNAIPSGTDFNIQLTDGSVVTADIADSNVTTAKIADANVTHAKLHTDMDLSGKTVTLPSLSGTLVVDGGSTNNNDAAAVFKGTSTEHIKLLLDTSSTGGHRASVALESNGKQVSIDTVGQGNLAFSTTSVANAMYITEAGNVGIGTTGPTNKLTIETTNQYGGLTITNGTNVVAQLIGFNSDNDFGGLKLYNSGAATVQLQSTAGAPTYFNSGGNVGIGTDSPSTRLHVKSGGAGNNYGSLYVQVDTNSNYPAMVIQTAAGGNGTETHGLYIKNTAAGYGLRIDDESSDTSPFVVDSSGRVGIGTTSPLSLLHIEPNSGNADVRIKRYATGDDARIYVQRKDNTGRAFTAYTNIDTSQTMYSGLLRNNNNAYCISNQDDYGKGVIVKYEDLSLGILEYGSGNSDNTDTDTHRKMEIWANGPGTNTYKRDCFVQHTPGHNQYSWYKVTLGSDSYGRAGSIRYAYTATTAHASGTGLDHGTFWWRANHGNSKCDCGGHVKTVKASQGGSYYGWTSAANFEIYSSNDTGSSAGFYIRVQGHISTNGGTYDGGVVQSIYLEIFGSQQNINNQGIYFVGHSTPANAVSAIGSTTLS